MSRNWRCVSCKYVHRKNVSACKNCDHTILQQTDEAPTKTPGIIAKIVDKLGF